MENIYNKLKKLSVRARVQLRKDASIEEDEWREKVYNLGKLVEHQRSLALNDEPSDGSDDGDLSY